MPQAENFKVDAISVMDLGGYIAESKSHNKPIQPIATLRLIFSLYAFQTGICT
jgi:hypothetical protein